MCACTIDGKVAPSSGSSSRSFGERIPASFTSKLLDLRDDVDAVMVGSNSVVLDNPRLKGMSKSKIRIVIDSTGKLGEQHRVISDNGPTIVLASETTSDEFVKRVQMFKNKKVIRVGDDRVNLAHALKVLGEIGIRTILVEGGGTLIYNLLEQRLIDEMRILFIPFFSGDQHAVSVSNGTRPLFPSVRLEVHHFEFLLGYFLIEGRTAYA